MFILTKLMGKRQISELNFFDYICGITIGSIAAEMATKGFKDLGKNAVAMAIYAFAAVIISLVCDKSIKCRRILSGTSTILMDNGKIFNKALAKSKMDMNEFMMECRLNGYFNLDDLQTVVLEPNGKLSFLPKSGKRNLNPEDIGIAPTQDEAFTTLVIDGEILKKNLTACGKDEQWLTKQIKDKGGKTETTLLAAVDKSDKFIYFERQNEPLKEDKFS